MTLGFVSAILPDLNLEQVVACAAEEGYDSVELMCWPPGEADRRYAGVAHIDTTSFNEADARKVNGVMEAAGTEISGLGYYPNPLAADETEATVSVDHLKKVIDAAAHLGVDTVNTFVGRDRTLTVDQNWPKFLQVWRSLIGYAEERGVRVGIENCPMFFTGDEWPGGNNLAHSPAIWRRMFDEIPSPNFGLNYDPSHLVWQRIDYIRPLKEFSGRIFHVHAKDVRIDHDRLDDVGILAEPNSHHTPKLPGLGDVDWGRFIAGLNDVGYDGPVVVEVEDRAYEGTLERRVLALRQSAQYLRQYIARNRNVS
ncbi:MAG: sugar phosphate isomerase/epimerase [Candidatus Latescibacteria bacterium]|jgi:sugar phosphate isomerase/epimerase|nr:sugar phosphate isomerase/epimerase [Candidatus Latescibacterota bacterium]